MQEINVNVDITADQVQVDSAENLQVTIKNTSEVKDYALSDGSILTGTLIKPEVTTLKGLQNELNSIDNQIATLQARKIELESLITPVTNKVNEAVASLQTVKVTPQIIK